MENNTYIRIDKRISEDKIKENLFTAHLKYIEGLKEKGFLMAGGFKKKDGGLIIFKSNSREKAEQISRNDPLIKKGYYDFELYSWDLKYISNIEEVIASG